MIAITIFSHAYAASVLGLERIPKIVSPHRLSKIRKVPKILCSDLGQPLLKTSVARKRLIKKLSKGRSGWLSPLGQKMDAPGIRLGCLCTHHSWRFRR